MESLLKIFRKRSLLKHFFLAMYVSRIYGKTKNICQHRKLLVQGNFLSFHNKYWLLHLQTWLKAVKIYENNFARQQSHLQNIFLNLLAKILLPRKIIRYPQQQRFSRLDKQRNISGNIMIFRCFYNSVF
jgi:hypothetical protein